MTVGCGQMGYYAQAAKGQLDIITNKQNIQSLIDNPKTSDTLREKLQLVRDIRQFAITEWHCRITHLTAAIAKQADPMLYGT